MSKTNYFPLGIAKGQAFCDRIIERKRLLHNLQKNQHSIVTSPRRYGKSSLVLFSLDESGIPFERVDLFVAVSAKTVEEQILKGVRNLINKIHSVPEHAVSVIKQYLKNLKSKWIVGTDGVKLELIPDKESDSISIVTEALYMLETLLRKKQTQAVFFIDEFQEIGVLGDSKGLEGAIRHVAQESERLTFIFSGSNRHILSSMFDDRSRPLYMLCDRITIDRIPVEYYVNYLDKVAKKQWKKNLDKTVMNKIFELTERHPYYMNVLGDKIWSYCTSTLPSIEIVIELWQEYILQEESKIARELSSLNTSQKKILIAIAQGAYKELTSKLTLQEIDLSSGGVIKALKYLEEQDYINRNKNGDYFVVDPLIKASLNLFYPH